MFTSITHDATPTGFGLLPVAARRYAVQFRAWRAQRQQVARVTAELNCYTERELADLGLSRADIPSVARGTFRRA
jgi:uncharacterized protein YjiS (DUF1127 family)